MTPQPGTPCDRMSEPYHEVVVAATGRARCKCTEKHRIQAGELKLVTYYTSLGRNHMDSISKSLVCISRDLAKAVLTGRTKNGVKVRIRINETQNPGAYLVCMSICDAIASGLPVSDIDKSFRHMLRKPVRKRQEAAGKLENEDDEVLTRIEVHCVCGKHARLIPTWEHFWASTSTATAGMDQRARRANADTVRAAYRALAAGTGDKRCEACVD